MTGQPAHRIAVKTDATVRGRTAKNAADVGKPVHGDLTGAATELLKNVGTSTQCERERRPYIA